MSVNITEITNIDVVLYYANWCPHCRDFFPKDESNNPLDTEKAESVKPEGQDSWQLIKRKLTEFGGYKITCHNKEESECTEKEKEAVEGWPTIIIKINDKLYRYKGGRNLKEIEESIKRGIEQYNSGKELVGGNINYHNIDYREKYKKYKKMYYDLVNKQ
jgi:thiol-disulfide isomerase/thioredoxin